MPVGALPDLGGVVQAVEPAVRQGLPVGLIVAIAAPYVLAALAVIANFVRGLVRDSKWR